MWLSTSCTFKFHMVCCEFGGTGADGGTRRKPVLGGSATASMPPRVRRSADVRLHGARGGRERDCLALHRAPHARLAQRAAWLAPLASGMERPQAQAASGA